MRSGWRVTCVLIIGLGSGACGTEPGDNASGSSVDTESSASSGGESTAPETTGTSGEAGSTDSTSTGETGGTEDPVLTDEDFVCILDWPKVNAFRVTNVLGDIDATLAVANSPDGGVYPVGSLLQLIPTEAMVKRAPGFAPQANDWEFFSLEVDAAGATIVDRGSETVVNAFGGNCFDCHAKAAPQWDFVCEQTHGCDPLPIGASVIESIQNGDPRCG